MILQLPAADSPASRNYARQCATSSRAAIHGRELSWEPQDMDRQVLAASSRSPADLSGALSVQAKVLASFSEARSRSWLLKPQSCSASLFSISRPLQQGHHPLLQKSSGLCLPGQDSSRCKADGCRVPPATMSSLASTFQCLAAADRFALVSLEEHFGCFLATGAKEHRVLFRPRMRRNRPGSAPANSGKQRPHSGQSAWTRLARGCIGHKLRVR